MQYVDAFHRDGPAGFAGAYFSVERYESPGYPVLVFLFMLALGSSVQAGLIANQRLESEAHNRMVVDQQDAYFAHRSSFHGISSRTSVPLPLSPSIAIWPLRSRARSFMFRRP